MASLKRVQTALKRYRASVLKAACEGDWPRTRVGDVAIDVRYGTSAKTNENSEGVPVLRMGNISEGRLVPDKLKFLPKSHPEFPDLFLKHGDLLFNRTNSAELVANAALSLLNLGCYLLDRQILEDGDIIFNRTNSAELVGKTAVYQGMPGPCSFASYLIRVRLRDDYLPEFLSYYLNSVFGRQWVASVVSQQVGQANVNGTKLKALEVPNPPIIEQQRIVGKVERRMSLIEELEALASTELQRATRLRQSILVRAFTDDFNCE